MQVGPGGRRPGLSPGAGLTNKSLLRVEFQLSVFDSKSRAQGRRPCRVCQACQARCSSVAWGMSGYSFAPRASCEIPGRAIHELTNRSIPAKRRGGKGGVGGFGVCRRQPEGPVLACGRCHGCCCSGPCLQV
jgi:hypothetical protein